MSSILLISESQSVSSYLPLMLQFALVGIVVLLLMFLTHVLGPNRKTKDKLVTFESGIEQVGNARKPIGVKYFIVAILFVLFDVEVIFFYPYAVNFRALGTEGFFAVVMFVAMFICGFVYVLKKGALKWED
ncbi:MAG TPA: NADH-quinone oxidoreductase subunit A [Edaphocola sp.]|nr:NADH-quinone oxidoreductase subunit A [Edaphocola sp.]